MVLVWLYNASIAPIARLLQRIFTGNNETAMQKSFSNDIVLVTGGAQGLGKEIAIKFAECGSTVILWDIDMTKLMETCSEMKSQGYEVFAYVVDCSKKDDVYQAAERVIDEVGNVSVIVNNAGILNTKTIMELEETEIRRLFDINFFSHYWTIKSFLPWMIDNNYGRVVSISSGAAFHGFPYLSDYCASKAAVRSLCENLTLELMLANKTGITVTCVHPGYINTNMANNSLMKAPIRIDQKQLLSPQVVAKQILKGVWKRKRTLFLPWYIYFIPLMKLLIPERMLKFIASPNLIKRHT